MLITNSTDFDYMEIGIASPDKVRYWSYGEVKSQKQLTTEHLNQKEKVCFVKKYLAR